jgi:signal transduction histidine kinase
MNSAEGGGLVAAGPAGNGRTKDLPELTALVAHELNNSLNGILLQIALLEQELPAADRPEMAAVKRLAGHAAKMLKRLQQYNRQELPQVGPVDVNAVIRETLAAGHQAGNSLPVQLQLAPELPDARGSPANLQRLLSLLLSHCFAVTTTVPRPIVVRTAREATHAILRIEDNGPAISADLLPQIFEPFVVARPGGDDTSLAVCKLLCGRMRGNFWAENLAQGGVAWVLELELA